MTIRINVKNFRGCEKADLVCDPICLLSGRNAAGKTSVVQAVAATLTGDPLQGLTTKGSAGVLVRSGAESGTASIRSDRGEFRVSWPECSAASDGEPPTATAYAAGIESIVDLDDKGRSRVLSEYLHSDPTKDDFAAEMRSVDLGDDGIINGLWKLIEDSGWDGAHVKRKEKGAEYKGQWQQIAGQNYGSRKAEAWEPEGWTEDLAAQTDRELEAAVADAKTVRDRAIAGDAATAERRRMLTDEAATLQVRQADLTAAEATLAEAEASLKAAKDRRDALPSTKADPGMPCPHCGNHVVITQVNLAERILEKAVTVPEGDLKKRRIAKAEVDGEIAGLEPKVGEASRKVAAAKVSVQIAQRAETDLAETSAAAEGAISPADADAALAAAEGRLKAFIAKSAADAIHARIGSNESAMKIMAPDGIRAKKLARVLDAFNGTQLAPLCGYAGWKLVEINADMTISYGSRRYQLLSESEKFRVRAVLQLAMARLDGSSMVVVDGADVLDGPTRGGLFSLLQEIEIQALIALTLTKPEQVPDISSFGVGNSYWISEGIAKPLAECV